MSRGKVPDVIFCGRAWVTVLLASATAAFVPSTLVAQTTANMLPALKQLSIEQLLEVDVLLPLRHAERAMDAPAAISVLTNEDIRRQGAVSIADALRTVPGLTVARSASAAWVITTRGFASTSSNKMLVMMDGRSVYSPLFSGVFWEQQDAVLHDLDRIEVVRGPGASLWGSNAVNGVINVVSKRASETQGSFVSVGAGAEEQLNASVRYGGRLGSGHYRVYGKFFERDAANNPSSGDARDGQRFGLAGFRWDFGGTGDGFTVQADILRSRVSLGAREDLEGDGVNVLARWTKRASSGAQSTLQTYYDGTRRFVQGQIEEQRQTVDVDVQHRWPINRRHALNIGAGYRFSADQTTPSAVVRFDPDNRSTNLATAFIQDQIALTSQLTAIIGSKVERNDYTGVEWQPSGRLRYMPNGNQTLWVALSRAVRMPTRFDTDLRILNAGAIVLSGNPSFRSETVIAYEGGYRVAPISALAFSVDVFRNRLDHLRTQELRAGRVVLGNGLNDTTIGATFSMIAQPREWATLRGSYTALSHDLSLDPDSGDLGGGLLETIDPASHAQVNGRFNLPWRFELDVMTRFIGALPGPRPPIPPTPAYNEASLRIGWRANSRLSFSLIARDLLHDDHTEFISPTSAEYVRLERAIYARTMFAF